MRKLFFSISLILITFNIYSQAGREWVRLCNGSGSFASANDITIDALGNILVTGYITSSISGADYNTAKYSPLGTLQWIHTYNGPGNASDIASYIKCDAQGNVIVAGTSEGIGNNPDFTVIKYSSSGVQQWIHRYDGRGPGYGGDNIKGLAVNNSGNIYITGTSITSSFSNDIVTAKYSTAGELLWM